MRRPGRGPSAASPNMASSSPRRHHPWNHGGHELESDDVGSGRRVVRADLPRMTRCPLKIVCRSIPADARRFSPTCPNEGPAGGVTPTATSVAASGPKLDLGADAPSTRIPPPFGGSETVPDRL